VILVSISLVYPLSLLTHATPDVVLYHELLLYISATDALKLVLILYEIDLTMLRLSLFK
jgi:hypothetical protein